METAEERSVQYSHWLWVSRIILRVKPKTTHVAAENTSYTPLDGSNVGCSDCLVESCERQSGRPDLT